MRIFISGPSGVGKSTIIKDLLQRHPDLVLSVSATTRAPRAGERDGIDYHFVSPATFAAMVAQEAFLEWAHVHDQRYGTPLAWIEEREQAGYNVLFDIDVQGVAQARQHGSPGCYIFIVPPGLPALKQRLENRGTEDPAALARRLANARTELGRWNMYDFVVVNDNLEQTIRDIETITQAYRHSRELVKETLPWLSAIE